jgi:hypothetical protein
LATVAKTGCGRVWHGLERELLGSFAGRTRLTGHCSSLARSPARCCVRSW